MADEEETVYRNVLWRDKKSGKIIRKKKNGRLIVCWMCPCCKPKVLASTITNYYGQRIWDLRPCQKEKMGLPGQKWRLRDVGVSHHTDPEASCSGTIYNTGNIDSQGRLIGLPDQFESHYSYNGYMELQMGCVREDGSVEWPCPNG